MLVQHHWIPSRLNPCGALNALQLGARRPLRRYRHVEFISIEGRESALLLAFTTRSPISRPCSSAILPAGPAVPPSCPTRIWKYHRLLCRGAARHLTPHMSERLCGTLELFAHPFHVRSKLMVAVHVTVKRALQTSNLPRAILVASFGRGADTTFPQIKNRYVLGPLFFDPCAGTMCAFPDVQFSCRLVPLAGISAKFHMKTTSIAVKASGWLVN